MPERRGRFLMTSAWPAAILSDVRSGPYSTTIKTRIVALDQRVLVRARYDVVVRGELRAVQARGIDLFTAGRVKIAAKLLAERADDDDDAGAGGAAVDRHEDDTDGEEHGDDDVRLLIAAACVRAHYVAAHETLARCRAWKCTVDDAELLFCDLSWPDEA